MKESWILLRSSHSGKSLSRRCCSLMRGMSGSGRSHTVHDLAGKKWVSRAEKQTGRAQEQDPSWFSAEIKQTQEDSNQAHYVLDCEKL